MTVAVLKTPLYDTLVARGGRMVEFAGWSLPLQYTGIIEEHLHTRSACSMFDISHMGRLLLTGDDCESLLNRLCTRNLTDAEVGRCYYSHMCREDGGILDDLIVSRFEKHWGVICNASNRDKIVAWINKHAEGTDVTLRDETSSTAMVALQGPKTLEVASTIVHEDIASIKRYRFRVFEIMGLAVTLYRSGYTGEDGFEIVVPAGFVSLMLPKILGKPEKPHPLIKPAGLGARDTLRIEAAMPLYGHELSEDWDSLTAGQSWCVDLSKEFVGADVMRKIKEGGLTRKLVGLELEGKRIARQNYPVIKSGQTVGEITSGTLSPTLGKSIAMGLVGAEHAEEGTALEISFRAKTVAAMVVKLPFYQRPKPAPVSQIVDGITNLFDGQGQD